MPCRTFKFYRYESRRATSVVSGFEKIRWPNKYHYGSESLYALHQSLILARNSPLQVNTLITAFAAQSDTSFELVIPRSSGSLREGHYDAAGQRSSEKDGIRRNESGALKARPKSAIQHANHHLRNGHCVHGWGCRHSSGNRVLLGGAMQGKRKKEGTLHDAQKVSQRQRQWSPNGHQWSDAKSTNTYHVAYP